MTKLFFTIVVAVAVCAVVAADNVSPAVTDRENMLKKKLSDEKFHNFKLQAEAKDALLKFLEHKDSKEYRNTCIQAAEKLLSENKDDAVNSAFIYAKINWMLGEYSSAIGMLNKIINNYPQYKTETFGFPVEIVARFWRAAIMQDSCQTALAQQNYEEILEIIEPNMKQYWGIAAITYLYLAEIARNDNNAKLSLKYLLKAQKIQCSPAERSTSGMVIKDWALFYLASREKPVDWTQKIIPKNTDAKRTAFSFIPNIYFQIEGRLEGNGIFSSSHLIFLRSLEETIEKSSSRIDKVFAAILLAHEYLRRKDYAGATRYFSAIYESDSFWAPDAGLLLISCLEKQGKLEDKEKIVDGTKMRFSDSYSLIISKTTSNAPSEILKLQDNACRKLIKFLEHRDSSECRDDCIAATEIFFKEAKDDVVNSAFIYAKINWTLGKHSSAIDALNRIIKDYPQYKTETFGFPVEIVARFWRAAIMQETRQTDQAKQNYQEILNFSEHDMKKHWNLAIIAYFHLAEIAMDNNDPKSVAEYLSKARKIQLAPADAKNIGTVISDWSTYNLTLQQQGVLVAQKALKPSKDKLNASYLMPMIYLQMNGLIGGGLSVRCGNPLFFQSLNTTMEKSVSNIDKVFAAILLAQEYLKNKDYVNSRKYCNIVYEGDSFWAPEAGLMLIKCMNVQGKQEEKKKVVDDMKIRFPFYSSPAPKK